MGFRLGGSERMADTDTRLSRSSSQNTAPRAVHEHTRTLRCPLSRLRVTGQLPYPTSSPVTDRQACADVLVPVDFRLKFLLRMLCPYTSPEVLPGRVGYSRSVCTEMLMT